MINSFQSDDNSITDDKQAGDKKTLKSVSVVDELSKLDEKDSESVIEKKKKPERRSDRVRKPSRIKLESEETEKIFGYNKLVCSVSSKFPTEHKNVKIGVQAVEITDLPNKDQNQLRLIVMKPHNITGVTTYFENMLISNVLLSFATPADNKQFAKWFEEVEYYPLDLVSSDSLQIDICDKVGVKCEQIKGYIHFKIITNYN